MAYFITLFVTVCASLFSLRADPIDDETGEILTDNWELGIVFYDSTINNGNTPLTEINWDASNEGYQAGTPRVITVQINYKNTSAVTTYNQGELEIKIPNLIYANSAGWTTSVIVGANDATHSGYDWTFNSSQNPSSSQEYYSFINANIIEEKANFEGSIQIQYTITPSTHSPEKFNDECVRNYFKTLQADLYSPTGDEPTVITSPNWPNRYTPATIGEELYWEHQNDNANCFMLTFDPNTTIYYNDYISIYNKENESLYRFTSNNFYGKTHIIDSNYMKIGMLSTVSSYNRFSVNIVPCKKVSSNILSFNYTRTYTHPWEQAKYYVSKEAQKLSSYDGLPSNASNYYWVKYYFEIWPAVRENIPWSFAYPDIGCTTKLYLTDVIPENCVAYFTDGTPIDIENNKITIPYSKMTETRYNSCSYGKLDSYIYLGYPKEIYNENLNNLAITNTVNLYGTYENETESRFLDDDNVSLNLLDFEFNYTGKLYGLSKTGYTYQNMSQWDCTSNDLIYQSIKNNDGQNYIQWQIYPEVYYTGTPLTVRIGDDLVYTTTENGGYAIANDDDYYYSTIYIPAILNRNNQVIPSGKYDISLYVRHANSNEFIHYKTFKNHSSQSSNSKVYSTSNHMVINFKEDEKIVAWYLQINDMNEGISSFVVKSKMMFVKENIPESGTIYNFAYLKVFSKDTSGNLTLLNNVDESSYANFITKEQIASYDLLNHNGYIQRAVSSENWSYYRIFSFSPTQSVSKSTNGTISQDAENEQFLGSFKISGVFSSTDFDATPSNKIFFEQTTDEHYQSNLILYDLLPEGMNLTSTKEQIMESFTLQGAMPYNKNKEPAFTDFDEMKVFFKEHTSITITENWNNTGRTRIKINMDFPDYPLVFRGTAELKPFTSGGHANLSVRAEYSYNYSISYDAFVEKGNSWKNYIYGQSTNTNISNLNNVSLKDNGAYDSDAIDITEDNSTEDKLLSSSATAIINSVVSTHQDVTTFVKTNHNHYMTGTADSDCNTEYEYKLRVRTGAADVTNLILYTNIEEAQPERQRWKGEFLGIDTSYATSKGYTVKPYYSENPKAGNLYNEDGTLNSDWKEYVYDTPAVYSQGLEVKFNSQCLMEYSTYDYVEIYYILNGTTYKLGKWGDTELAGKTMQIPTNDFYLYWHTDTSASSFYGFSIDSITHINIENTNTTKGTIPSYTPEEISGNTYPDSAFDSYTHNNYGDNVDKLWHYTYTGEKELIQETIQGTNKTKVKSLAFEYLDSEGNPAIIPANSITYVLINMKSPSDKSLRTLARMDCRTQWNALDEFDRPVDFITGINSNVVKVALPNSIDEDNLPSISLKFIKEITGTDSQFKNMKLDRINEQIFIIRLTNLTANDDGSYDQVIGLLSSTQGLSITNIPIGTYLLEELGDNYFDFVEFSDNNDPEIIIEGVTFERTDQGYIITVSEDLTENIEFNIKVTNEIEQFRPYEDKENKENLFLKNKIEGNE